MCRPLITSNIHGCMEAVENGVTGYLAEVRNADSLTEAMLRFVALPYEEKQAMGLAGRKRMEAMFDKNMVVQKTMNEIFADERENVK